MFLDIPFHPVKDEREASVSPATQAHCEAQIGGRSQQVEYTWTT